ncbi:MAG TPA: MBL fold metallo-hydrolase, partial [Longimicrobiales bacterium]|nr:MBL fold metallo-hydrolase [Longimicrobiales bacterium]
LETGIGPEGEALTPEDRAAVSRSLALREAYLDDLSSLRVLPPDVVFTERLTLHLGDRRVELVHLGPAHTAGDVVVHLPGEGVVAVGDLLEQGPPWLDGAFVPGWADALARLREISPTRVLPAHGRLQGDTRLLDWQAEFLGALVDGARAALGEGLEAEEAVARAGLDRFREQFASVGVAGDALDRWLVQAMGEAMADVAGDGG